jgi:hypothetical protein
MPRYRTTGLPPEAANGHTAFMPHYNRLAASGAQSYKTLTGGPVQRIPVSNLSATTPSPDLGDIAQMGSARSSDAPPAIWPDQYVPLPAWEPGAMIQRNNPTRPQDTTMIPVPAGNLAPALRMHSALLSQPVQPGGRGTPRWPRQLIRWPNWKPGQGNG